MNAYKIKIPLATNPHVVQLLSKLELSSEPMTLKVTPSVNDEPGMCIENVHRKVREEGGEAVYGWQLWEHPYMIEAEFHSVWRNSNGDLIDITPKDDREIEKILFVLDKNQIYDGVQVENARINTTDSILVDDIIEIERAKYRFMNKDGRDKIIGVLPLDEESQLTWMFLNDVSAFLEHQYFSGHDTNATCFCRSGEHYETCHRQSLLVGLKEI